MRHVHMTCKNHPELRWTCKEIAFSDAGGYNGMRNIFFHGKYAPEDPNALLGTISWEPNPEGGVIVHKECDCPPSDLVRAPEDAEKEQEYEAWLKEQGYAE